MQICLITDAQDRPFGITMMPEVVSSSKLVMTSQEEIKFTIPMVKSVIQDFSWIMDSSTSQMMLTKCLYLSASTQMIQVKMWRTNSWLHTWEYRNSELLQIFKKKICSISSSLLDISFSMMISHICIWQRQKPWMNIWERKRKTRTKMILMKTQMMLTFKKLSRVT